MIGVVLDEGLVFKDILASALGAESEGASGSSFTATSGWTKGLAVTMAALTLSSEGES